MLSEIWGYVDTVMVAALLFFKWCQSEGSHPKPMNSAQVAASCNTAAALCRIREGVEASACYSMYNMRWWCTILSANKQIRQGGSWTQA